MARVEFNITIEGNGRTPEIAWADAVERLRKDFKVGLEPAIVPDETDYNVYCEDCNQGVNNIDQLVDGQLCQKCHLKEENDEDEVEKG